MLTKMLRAAARPTITYVNNYTSTSGLTTYTFTTSGNFRAGLYVVGVIAENASTAGRTLSSVTYDGTAMTSIVNTASGTGAGGTLIGAIFSYVETNSDTVAPNFVVTFSGAMSRCNIGVWRINNNRSNAVFDTDTSSISGTASSRTNTVNALKFNAVGVSILANGNNATTSWTNATERYEAFASGTGGSGADFQAEAEGDRTITATATSGTNDGLVLVTGVWN